MIDNEFDNQTVSIIVQKV